MAESTRSTLSEIKNKKKRTEIEELLAEQAKWARIKKEAEENVKSTVEILAPMLEELGISNILAHDDEGTSKQFILVHGASVHIDKMSLIEMGVDPEIVDRATKRSEYVTVSVRAVKEAV